MDGLPIACPDEQVQVHRVRQQGTDGMSRFGSWACLAWALTLLQTATVSAQGLDPQDLFGRPKLGGGRPRIDLSAQLTPEQVAPGGTVTLTIRAKLPTDYYLYGIDGKFGGRTRIQTQAEGLTAIDADFVPDREPKRAFSEEFQVEISKHEGEVSWSRRYRVTAAAEAMQVSVRGTLEGQYCRDTAGGECIPIRPPFRIDVTAAIDPHASREPSAEGSAADTPGGPSPPVREPADGDMTDAAEGANGTNDAGGTGEAADDGDAGSPFAISPDDVSEKAAGGDIASPFAVEGDNPADGVASQGSAAVGLTGVARPPAPQDQGLFPFLLVCIGGGFLALLTPCSFPMVPITVSFFLKQSEKSHRKSWVLACVYCGTIVLAFTILGVGIALVFGASGLTQLANNVWLNLFAGFVFVLFGLNMLGAFEIHVPSSWLSWTAAHESTGSYVGAVFMALTFTLTSFTCTFAVVGTLLVMAAQGTVVWPVIGMLAFSTAFASPFFVLALLPSLLAKIPKSGGWMNSVKVVMGLIEIGAAVKFLSIADIAWNPQPVLLDYATVMLIWSLLALVIGLYLLGVYRFHHDVPVNGISTGRGLLAFGFLWLSGLLAYLLFLPERANGLVMDQIVAFAPPQIELGQPAGAAHAPIAARPADPASNDDLGLTTVHHGMVFSLEFDRAVAVARRTGRPLLLDFTGVNCVNCRRMERKMAEPQNRQWIEQFVAVQLYTDKVPGVPDREKAEQILKHNIDLQERLLHDVTLPSYAVLAPDGETLLAAYQGYEARSGEFTAFLEGGWQRWQSTRLAAKP
jgi:thiol:disulfide interchange protein